MKNLIIEEINRVKLLMNYNNKTTLSENLEKILMNESVLLNEQTAKSFLKSIFGSTDEVTKAANTLTKDAAQLAKDARYMAGVKLFDDVAVYAGLKNGDEVMKALMKNTLTKAQLSELAKGLMKTGKATGSLRTSLTSRAAELVLKDSRYINLSEKEIKNTLVKKGYDPAIADEIASKVMNKRGVNPKGKETNWMKFKTNIKNMTKGKALRYLLTAGGVYLAWKWYTSPKATPLPECITRSSSPEDFKKMSTDGLDYAIVTETGNEIIDNNGGGIFYDDKEFKTGNGKYEGTWSDEGGIIVMNIGGTEYTMDCAGTEDEPEEDEEEDGGGGGGSITYTQCTSFPMDLGCISSNITKVQECLKITPVDGKLGPITKGGITSAGYSFPLTENDFNKIMSNCGKSDEENKPTEPEGEPTFDDVTNK